jgi:transcriptional regulator with XRE-family HTH domain/predicted restriction endonuclease
MLNETTLSFGEHVRKLRKSKGISQERLAELIETHPNHIGSIERNERKPGIDLVKKLATVLDTGFEEYFKEPILLSEQTLHSKIDLPENIWAFKTVSEGRAYEGNDGYADVIDQCYIYDTTVPNHKNVKANDWVVLVNKKEILGLARIANIKIDIVTKSRYRCPVCGNTQVEKRKTKTPPYRCNKGHEFEHRDSEEIEVTQFTANYSSFFHTNRESNSLLKDFYHKGFNRNMSIQNLSENFILTHFPSIAIQLQGKNENYSTQNDLTAVNEENNGYESNENDERVSVLRQIKARRGQAEFRRAIRRRYGDRCMVTGCELVEILEAAHINPYKGKKDNHAENGLLLRSDIHTLFDLDLLGIEPEKMTIHIKPEAMVGEYAQLNGKPLLISSKMIPSFDALTHKWKKYCNKKAED